MGSGRQFPLFLRRKPQNLGVEACENRGLFGDRSPMIGGSNFGSVAIETGYLRAQHLGGNSWSSAAGIRPAQPSMH